MREWNFHPRSQKLGMEFSRSRSQKLGMKFFIPVPVPKVWEWAEPFPFPFPNDQKSFPLTPSPVLNWGRHRGSGCRRKGASENPPGQGSAKRCQRTAMKMNRNISVLLVTKMMTMLMTSISASFICASLTRLHLASEPYLDIVFISLQQFWTFLPCCQMGVDNPHIYFKATLGHLKKLATWFSPTRVPPSYVM